MRFLLSPICGPAAKRERRERKVSETVLPSKSKEGNVRESSEFALVLSAQSRMNGSEGRLFRSEFRVEVARIGRRTDRGEEGRRNTLVENVVPIRIFEEEV